MLRLEGFPLFLLCGAIILAIVSSATIEAPRKEVSSFIVEKARERVQKAEDLVNRAKAYLANLEANFTIVPSVPSSEPQLTETPATPESKPAQETEKKQDVSEGKKKVKRSEDIILRKPEVTHRMVVRIELPPEVGEAVESQQKFNEFKAKYGKIF